MWSEGKGRWALKIGPFVISRTRRTKSGLRIYPWQALTEDRVSPELRQVVAKVARSECKNYLSDPEVQSLIQRECRDYLGRVFEPCTGPHRCRPDDYPVSWCRKSCTQCSGREAVPCYFPDETVMEDA